MATGSPAKPWERNRAAGTSSLRTDSTPQETSGGSPALPSRNGLGGGSAVSRVGSPYSGYGSSTNGYGSTSMYGGMGGYGSRYGGSTSMYGGMGSSYGGLGSTAGYGGRYGSSMYGGMGSMGSMGGYGSRYGSSMYGGMGSMGSMGGYGSSYGGIGSTYSRYGSGYDDASYRNPYPRGKYWSYGAEEDEFGNPIDPENNGSLLMDMENVVEGFGHFTRILDYNFDAVHCSFASVLRLFDSMGELRRAIYYGLQGLAVFTLLGKCFRYLQKILFTLLGKPIPEGATKKQIKESMESFEDQWSGSGQGNIRARGQQPNVSRKRKSRALLLLLGFFAVILGGPVLFSALYRALVGPKANQNRRKARTKPQAIAQYDFAGEAEGDLPFKKGEIITIRRPVSEGWLEGELTNGRVGLVPESYIVPYSPNVSPPHNREQPHHHPF